MLLKSATFVFLIVIVHSATIQPRNIPVEVKYEDKKENKDVEVVPEGVSNYIRNLDAKVQLSPEELRAIPEQSSEEINKPEQPVQSNSLEETTEKKEEDKPEEQSIALKSVPTEDIISEGPKEVVQEIVQEPKEVVQEIVQDDSQQESTSQAPAEQPVEKKEEEKKEEPIVDEKPKEDKPAEKREIIEEISSEVSGRSTDSTEVSKEIVTEANEFKNDGEPQKLQDSQTEQPAPQEEKKSEEKTPEQPKEDNSSEPALLKELPSEAESDKNAIEGKVSEDKPVEQKPVKDTLTLSSIIQEARNVIKNGLKELKESLKTETDAPKPEQWDNLETTVTNYLNDENKQTEAQNDKPVKQNFIQKIAGHFQSLTDEFLKSLGGSDEKESTEKPDEADSKPKDEARDNSQPEQIGTPCGAVATFLQTGFSNIQKSLSNIAQDQPANPTSTESTEASATVALGSRNLSDQVAQDESSADSSSTSLPESTTEQVTTAKIEEPAQKLEELPAISEEIPASDSSSSEESDSSSSESQSITEESQSQNTTTENSKDLSNETTTSK